MPGPDDDKKVKELFDPALDPVTRADLERWFSLPSFEQLADQAPAEPAEPTAAEVEREDQRKRRDEAIAAVDPGMLARYLARVEPQNELVTPLPPVELHVDQEIGKVDHKLIQRRMTIAEPREVELPQEVYEDLNACTPQALLRDLHRPELTFEKVFDVIDVSAESRVDVAARINEAMTRSTASTESQLRLATEEIHQARVMRAQPWTDFLGKLRNRTVTE